MRTSMSGSAPRSLVCRWWPKVCTRWYMKLEIPNMSRKNQQAMRLRRGVVKVPMRG